MKNVADNSCLYLRSAYEMFCLDDTLELDTVNIWNIWKMSVNILQQHCLFYSLFFFLFVYGVAGTLYQFRKYKLTLSKIGGWGFSSKFEMTPHLHCLLYTYLFRISLRQHLMSGRTLYFT